MRLNSSLINDNHLDNSATLKNKEHRINSVALTTEQIDLVISKINSIPELYEGVNSIINSFREDKSRDRVFALATGVVNLIPKSRRLYELGTMRGEQRVILLTIIAISIIGDGRNLSSIPAEEVLSTINELDRNNDKDITLGELLWFLVKKENKRGNWFSFVLSALFSLIKLLLRK